MSIAVAMASLFAVSYILALGRPVLHHLPAAVVGDPTHHALPVEPWRRAATMDSICALPVR